MPVDSRIGYFPSMTSYSALGSVPGLPADAYARPATQNPLGLAKSTAGALTTAANDTLAEHNAGVVRNQLRGQSILAGYDQRLGNSRAVADQNQQMVDQFGGSQRQFINDQNARNLSAATTSANRRGLGNTTIRDAQVRGADADFYRANLALNDSLLGNRLNVSNQNIGRENELTDQRLQYLTNIDDQYPTLGDAQNYALQASVSRQSDKDRAAAKKAAKIQKANEHREAVFAKWATIPKEAPLMGDADFSTFAFHNSGINAWQG